MSQSIQFHDSRYWLPKDKHNEGSNCESKTSPNDFKRLTLTIRRVYFLLYPTLKTLLKGKVHNNWPKSQKDLLTIIAHNSLHNSKNRPMSIKIMATKQTSSPRIASNWSLSLAPHIDPSTFLIKHFSIYNQLYLDQEQIHLSQHWKFTLRLWKQVK